MRKDLLFRYLNSSQMNLNRIHNILNGNSENSESTPVSEKLSRLELQFIESQLSNVIKSAELISGEIKDQM